MGVYAPGVAPLMADALRRLGSRRALVVHSAGLDELTPMAPADVVEVTQNSQRSYWCAAGHGLEARLWTSTVNNASKG